MGKNQKVSLSAGKKGRLKVRTTNRAIKLANSNSLALARMARHNPPSFASPASIVTATTIETVSTIDSTASVDNLKGVEFEEFMSKRLDFRHWGTLTYKGFVESRMEEDLLDILAKYSNCKNATAAQEFFGEIAEHIISNIC